MDLHLIALVIPIWVLLPFSLIVIYLLTRRIGIYHILDVFDANGESIRLKIKLIFQYNLYLSFILALAIYITIITLKPDIGISKIAVITIIVVYIQLFSQRVLLHPNKSLVNYIHNACHHLDRISAIENYKENLLSFIYGFINVSVIVVLLLESINILTNTQIIFPEFNGQNTGHADLIWAIIRMFFCYGTFLLSATLLSESFLFIVQPELQRTNQGENKIITETKQIKYKYLYMLLSILLLLLSWFIYTYL